MLDPEVKADWLKALRGRSYKQAVGSLRTIRQTYCCLGVLCDLFYNSGWELHRVEGMDNRRHYRFRYKGESDGCLVPKTVRQKIGLDRKAMIKLSNMNDSGYYSFKDLADYIEKNL
jgi:hypothetical protein